MTNTLMPPKNPRNPGDFVPRLPDDDIDHLDFSPWLEGHEPYPRGHLVGKVILEDRIETARQAFLDGSVPLSREEESLLALIDDEVIFPEDEAYRD